MNDLAIVPESAADGMDGRSLIVPDGVFEEIQASTYKNPTEWFFEAMTGGMRSDSGISVNSLSILTHPSVWQAINILAGDLGQVPWALTRVDEENGRQVAVNHPVQVNLQFPNDHQTAGIWKETIMQYALWGGNGMSEIVRRGGNIVTLGVPIHPSRLAGWDMTEGGELFYMIRDSAGIPEAKPAENYYHIRGLTSDGIWGHDLLRVAKNAIGLGLALQKHGNSTFRNGARPQVVLKHPGHMTDDARANLRREWNEIHQGSDNSGKVAVLWENMELMPFSTSNEDAQWIDARRLDRTFIASLFNLPAYKLNALEDSSVRANLEQQNRDYLLTSLARWFNQFNEEARLKLLARRERRDPRLQFYWDTDEWLKGDFESRMKGYNLGITSKVLKPNEARTREGLPPDPEGDQLENPNTTSGNASAAHRELVADAVARLMSAERTRVMQCVRNKNFLAAVEAFYASGWPSLVAKILGPVANVTGIHQDTCALCASTHARLSKADLLDAAGTTDADGLKEAVREVCQAWQDRASGFVADLLGEEDESQREE